jgi:hypothetical protein
MLLHKTIFKMQNFHSADKAKKPPLHKKDKKQHTLTKIPSL